MGKCIIHRGSQNLYMDICLWWNFLPLKLFIFLKIFIFIDARKVRILCIDIFWKKWMLKVTNGFFLHLKIAFRVRWLFKCSFNLFLGWYLEISRFSTLFEKSSSSVLASLLFLQITLPLLNKVIFSHHLLCLIGVVWQFTKDFHYLWYLPN